MFIPQCVKLQCLPKTKPKQWCATVLIQERRVCCHSLVLKGSRHSPYLSSHLPKGNY